MNEKKGEARTDMSSGKPTTKMVDISSPPVVVVVVVVVPLGAGCGGGCGIPAGTCGP